MFTIFLLFLIVEFVLLSALVYNDQYSWTTTFTLAGLGLYLTVIEKGGYATWWTYISTHPGTIIWLTILYFVLGVVWSFFKWYVSLKDYRTKNTRDGVFNEYASIPIASKNTSKIIGWMSYWPISIVIYILRDWIHNLYTWIYGKVSKIYDKITDSVFKDIKERPKRP